MGDCIRGPRPCQGIKLSRTRKCCRKACRARPAGVMRGARCVVRSARCAVRGVQCAVCSPRVMARARSALSGRPAGRPRPVVLWHGRKTGLPSREMPRQRAAGSGGARRQHPQIRPFAHPLYRLIALPLSRPPAFPKRRPGAARQNSSAHSHIRPFAHSPSPNDAQAPHAKIWGCGGSTRHHFGTKAAPTRRAPTMARSPISAIWQTPRGAAVRRHRPPSRGGLGSPPRPSSLERSYAAHTARESAVRNPAFSR